MHTQFAYIRFVHKSHQRLASVLDKSELRLPVSGLPGYGWVELGGRVMDRRAGINQHLGSASTTDVIFMTARRPVYPGKRYSG